MKESRVQMGMPITVEIVDENATKDAIDGVFSYFTYIDEKFSTYKTTSEITQINEGRLSPDQYSDDMKTVFALSEETKKLTNGYFDIQKEDGTIDPSGLVKGWAIYYGAEMLKKQGFKNYSVEIGGDIEVAGKNGDGKPWRIGIREPVSGSENIVKTLHVTNRGVATSGTYLRGQHIYNPREKKKEIHNILSLTVIGPNIYEADRFATAAFAMGEKGILFIEQLPGFEGYMINSQGIATMTSGFEQYTHPYAESDR